MDAISNIDTFARSDASKRHQLRCCANFPGADRFDAPSGTHDEEHESSHWAIDPNSGHRSALKPVFGTAASLTRMPVKAIG
jgi:hypothetical protein